MVTVVVLKQNNIVFQTNFEETGLSFIKDGAIARDPFYAAIIRNLSLPKISMNYDSIDTNKLDDCTEILLIKRDDNNLDKSETYSCTVFTDNELVFHKRK